MDAQKQLKNYIYTQIQSGLQPNEISEQLRTAGWDEASIQNAFKDVQSLLVPSPAAEVQDHGAQPNPQQLYSDANSFQQSLHTPTVHYGSAKKKRGRIKTAWLLLKQSFKVLKSNKQLIKYPLMGGLISFLITAIFALIFFAASDTLLYTAKDAFGDEEFYLTAPGMVVAFVYYVLSFFAISFYNAGLAAHVLDIFRGTSKDYKYYIGVAWSKKLPILMFSIISATVGMILQAIEQRSRIFGYIVSRIFGTLWTLANLFTIPIIVETNSTAPSAIKQSTKLFISRWGENIAGRVSFGLIAFLIYMVLFMPLAFILIFTGASFGSLGLIISIILLIILTLAFVTVEVAASNILSAALYFYARYEQIPAAYDQELLNSAFIQKKKRSGFLHKK